MKAHRARLGMLMAVVTLTALAVSAPARADTVTQWNLNAVNALARDAGQGAIAVPHLAMVHGAIYDAVNAIDRRYEPYLVAPRAKRWYSKDAAAATAAYRVLVSSRPPLVLPAQQPALEAALAPLYVESLAAIPNGPAKTGGIATGEAAANAMIAARSDDGRFGPFRFLVGSPPGSPDYTPGQWRPTLPLFVNDPGAWLKDVKPFLIRNSSQFRSDGPLRLTSRRYAKEFAEVKTDGALTSTTRTLDQTNAALHWGAENPVGTWGRIVRSLADEQGLSIADNARFFAMLYLTGADAGISAWDDKAYWSFWRPITAIREADADGNAATEADAEWLPRIANPPYPDHPSGLSAFSGAFVRTLQDFFGTDRVAFSDTNAAGTLTWSYTRLSQVIEEVIDARVWSGIHFRTADVQGAGIGRKVARWRKHHYFQAVRDDHDHDHHDDDDHNDGGHGDHGDD